MYYKVLQKHKVAAELHIYQNDKHGFGISPDVIDNGWMTELRKWLILNKL